jgi:hypothetical protein
VKICNYAEAPGYWVNGKPVIDSSIPRIMISRIEKGIPIPILFPSKLAMSLAPKQYGEKFISPVRYGRTIKMEKIAIE